MYILKLNSNILTSSEITLIFVSLFSSSIKNYIKLYIDKWNEENTPSVDIPLVKALG